MFLPVINILQAFQIDVRILGYISGSKTAEKPVATIFFHILTPTDKINYRKVFNGSPEEIVLQDIDKTAELFLESIATI